MLASLSKIFFCFKCNANNAMIFNKSHYMFKHKRCIIDEVIQILDNSLPKYLLRIYKGGFKTRQRITSHVSIP